MDSSNTYQEIRSFSSTLKIKCLVYTASLLYMFTKPFYDREPEAARKVIDDNSLGKFEDPRVSDTEHNYEGISFDVIRPKSKGDQCLPLLYYIHGGGWLLNTQYDYKKILYEICCNQEAAVVYIHYGLTPEHIYPKQNEQCSTVLEHLIIQRQNYMLTDNVIIMGDSAGANLAYFCCKQLYEQYKQIKALILAFPCFDERMNTASYKQFEDNVWLPKRAMKLFWDLYSPEPVDHHALVTPLDVPTLLIVANNDVLRDEALDYSEKCQVYNKITTVNYIGMIHGFSMLRGLTFASKTHCLRLFETFIGKYKVT
jgi:acetyl esterase/lipase